MQLSEWKIHGGDGTCRTVLVCTMRALLPASVVCLRPARRLNECTGFYSFGDSYADNDIYATLLPLSRSLIMVYSKKDILTEGSLA